MDSESEDMQPQDVFNILIASDIHLGFCEKDPERGTDSFNTFEEILQLAVKHDVDFILLGGDLFHYHNPSQNALHKCTSLIRQYCMGDRPVSVEFLSDQSINFKHCVNPIVNYEDPNMNVSIPIFSINGNHDDCSAVGLSAMDVLSSSGLVNYFGKVDNLSNVEISPLLLRKGESYLALYGLSYIKDERLSRLFRDGKVRMLLSQKFREKWFNLMVLHQNRANHGQHSYIPEETLPNVLDLVFWGHEHECRIDPEKNPTQDFYVTQPGSSVATSLCVGESVPKHVGLLQIHGKKQKITKLKLETVRPFVMDTVVLSRHNLNRNIKQPTKEIEAFLVEKVEELIRKSKDLLTGHPKQPTKPLIRIRVEYREEWQLFNAKIFGQQFQAKVMNSEDMILLRVECKGDKKSSDVGLDLGVIEYILGQEEVQTSHGIQIEQVIEKYFENPENNAQLEALSSKGLGHALAKLLDYEDDESLKLIVEHQSKKLVNHLISVESTLDTVDEDLRIFREQRLTKLDEEERQEVELLERSLEARGKKNRAPQNGVHSDSSDNDDDDDDDDAEVSVTSLKSSVSSRRGKGLSTSTTETLGSRPARGRGSRGTRGSRARGASSSRGTSSSQQRNMQDFMGGRTSSRASKSRLQFLSDEED